MNANSKDEDKIKAVIHRVEIGHTEHCQSNRQRTGHKMWTIWPVWTRGSLSCGCPGSGQTGWTGRALGCSLWTAPPPSHMWLSSIGCETGQWTWTGTPEPNGRQDAGMWSAISSLKMNQHRALTGFVVDHPEKNQYVKRDGPNFQVWSLNPSSYYLNGKRNS